MLMDFKENIKIGGSPREVGAVFYSKSQRIIFCATVITKNDYHFFDFISEDLSHDTFFIIH